jgi:hypothetical protein
MAARYRYPPCAAPQYVSSKIEAQWLSRSAVNRICVTTMLQSNVAHDGWLPYAADVSGENGDRKPRDGAEADAISTLSAPETSFRVAILSLSQAWHGIRAPALAALSTKMPGVAVVLNPWACPE